MSLRVLDLFSGLGGASEAFVQAGDEVLRIDNNPLLSGVPHTEIMDVAQVLEVLREYHVARRRYDVVWCSPPCLEFSQAFNAPGPTARREGREFSPDLSLMQLSLEFVKLLQPRWWVIENVRGACPHFNPILGEPTQVIGSLVLWGRFPELRLPEGWSHRKSDVDKRWSVLRANHRAKVPLEVSQALRTAVLAQRQLI